MNSTAPTQNTSNPVALGTRLTQSMDNSAVLLFFRNWFGRRMTARAMTQPHDPKENRAMGETSLAIRLDNGSLSEREADDAFLSQYHDLKAEGLIGGALIRKLIDVDPAHPPLSMRVSGLDQAGERFDELICYSD